MTNLDVPVQNTLGVQVMDPLEGLVADHSYQGLLHDGLRDDVRQWAALHVLHHHEQVHLHQVSLQTINYVISVKKNALLYLFKVDQVGMVQLLHNFYFH